MTDYRCPDFIKEYGDFHNKKEGYRKELKEKNGRISNYYNHVNHGKGKIEFSKLYGKRCAYCGVSVGVSSLQDSFQIDHIVPKSEGENNDISNLTFSCRKCNQAKKANKIIVGNIIHPDSDLISSMFVRNEDFSISISQKYENDSQVLNYYSTLKLSDLLKRLDYAISVLFDMIKYDKVEGRYISECNALLVSILETRNLIC